MAEPYTERIDRDHALIDRCIDAGHDDEREFYAREIAELTDARLVFEATRRELSKAHSRAMYAEDLAGAARISRQITELEARQP
jgi:hypothetical protein